jgi:hypothetical protein
MPTSVTRRYLGIAAIVGALFVLPFVVLDWSTLVAFLQMPFFLGVPNCD